MLKRSQLCRQQRIVPAGIQRELIVREDVSAFLRLGEVMRSTHSFQLQFSPIEIGKLARSYGYEDDTELFAAGGRIVGGECTRSNLEITFRWKTGGRGISRLGRNSDFEIEDALRLAAVAKTDRSAAAVLRGLYGVNVPVASAVLTAMDQERFTIIDFRALESLGVTNYIATVDYYLQYLEHCRSLANQHGVGLRELDRALWQWSKQRRTLKNP